MLLIILTGTLCILCIVLSRLFRGHLSKDSFVLINAKKTNDIEYAVRRAVLSHPRSDIYIINRCPDPNMRAILRLLKSDYPFLYIIDS
ncbi:MAG: hypothetical protein PUF72_09570 [Clostridiales bacterium]|nr:hypothetical protein [Clostridiales bacterium]